MSMLLRRGALLAAAALALPLLPSASALAQSRAAPPPSRVTAPKIELPADITGLDPAAEAAQKAAAAAIPGSPAAAAQAAQMAEGVAAVVNDDIISTYDLRQRMRLLV